MSLTAQAIDRANAAGRAAFVGYLPLGYPDLQTSIDAAVALAESGADVLELGPPYSDPVMDGVVIQEATQKALENGFRVAQVFEAVRAISGRVKTPILVMTYWNLVLQYGVEKFAKDLKQAGGAGLITPDITPDNAAEWLLISDKYGLDRIFLAAQTSTDKRLKMIAEKSRGFVYAVSTMGITGQREQLDKTAAQLVQRLREVGAQRICVGIGISNSDHVAAVSGYSDGAIVGTALVRALRNGGIEYLREQTTALSSGTRR